MNAAILAKTPNLPGQSDAMDHLKPWRTLQAECLLGGFAAALIDGDDGRPMLVVSRWALTRSFSEVGEAQAWLRRAKGPSA